MAERIPHHFLETTANFIASFNFTDVATGLGYVNYYGASGTDENADDTYFLIPTTDKAHNKEVTQVGLGTQEFNFTSTVFQIPRTVKGTAYVVARGNRFGGSGSASGAVTIKVVGSDGTTETNISDQVFTDTFQGSEDVLMTIPLTQTTVKKGESLRAELVLSTGSGTSLAWGTDPSDSGSTNLSSSIFKIAIPFRID